MQDSKRKVTLLLSLCLLLASTFVLPVKGGLAQTTQGGLTTLYSPNKYPNTRKKICIQFHAPEGTSEPCDLFYGNLYAGDELDWFQSSGAAGNRSVIKDLGSRNWNSALQVPAVEPLPKLKPGEQRQVTIDVSGADGKDGCPGAPGQPGADADGIVRNQNPISAGSKPTDPCPQRPNKRDGKPKIDPLFVKAIVEHMYVIHVVDDVRDFYALFRVEALERGDNCTISWQFIPAPESAKTSQE